MSWEVVSGRHECKASYLGGREVQVLPSDIINYLKITKDCRLFAHKNAVSTTILYNAGFDPNHRLNAK